MKIALREKLAYKCKVFKELLSEIIEPLLTNETGYSTYYNRYKKLDAALQEFIDKPSNFDSRHSQGLAEKIYNAAPVSKMLMGNEKYFFKLAPGGYKKGEFEPSNLARVMEKAYRKELIDYDYPNKEKPFFIGLDYKQFNYDLIYSELAGFFFGIQSMLRNNQTDKNQATQRKKTVSREDYETLALNRARIRDPNLMKLFSRKCCNYCFRLIHKRSGGTKTTISKTCSLHDPITNRGLYNIARNQDTKIKSWKEENNKPEKDSDLHFNPHLIPKRLNVYMSQALEFNYWDAPSEPIYDLTIKLLETDPKKIIDECTLEKFINCVIETYPPIANPKWLANSVQKLSKDNRHTSENLKILLTMFVKDDYLPFHPNIIAFYMVLFKQESWYAEEYNKNYYNTERTKGRPAKIDVAALLAAAEKFKIENPKVGRNLASDLALRFDITPTRVRQILRKVNKKVITP